MSTSGPNSRAILLMIGAVLCFSLMDAAVKALAPRIGVLPTLWTRYAGQMLVVMILVSPRFRSVLKTRYVWLQLLRSVFLFCATGSFFIAISRVGLAEVTAVMNVNPVLITLGAGLILGERLGPRRIAGIAVAMIGALIVIRPGATAFSPDALFALLGACFYSAYSLTTRYVGKNEDVWTSMIYTSAFGTVILTAALPAYWQTPDMPALGLMALVTVFGTTAQLLLIRALSAGEASMLAPFAYCGLIFATVWGLVFFAEIPDALTISGALVIAGAGLYVWHRETFGKRSHT
ncbi:DMT family transporter [Shimia biformata]|uniref:DMT family transporter n=1 Tax=Shimia biformata TaxID=1294299 RepID=UPI0019514CCC|nr:DMT family transporter [Shimia biformata]